jgi:hypothetical protein
MDEMGKTCSMQGEDENRYKILVGWDHLGNLDANDRIILKWILKT